MQQGGGFVYGGVKVVIQEGVLKWVAINGNHIPVFANPSGECRRCADLRKPEAERKLSAAVLNRPAPYLMPPGLYWTLQLGPAPRQPPSLVCSCQKSTTLALLILGFAWLCGCMCGRHCKQQAGKMVGK